MHPKKFQNIAECSMPRQSITSNRDNQEKKLRVKARAVRAK